MTIILDGESLNKKIGEELKLRIAKSDIKPKLAIFQVGNSKESEIFISKKIKYAKNIGAETVHIRLSEKVSQKEMEDKLRLASGDVSIHGIIIQLPLPEHLDISKLTSILDWKKDVDGLGVENLRRLWFGEKEGIIPATARGIIELLDFYHIPVSEKKVTIVNRSFLVGKPLALVLLNLGATVSICHSRTSNLDKEMRNADIVISAVGKPKIFGGGFFGADQVIIDVGISYESLPAQTDQKISGDVDFEDVVKKAKAISPVPGGVGPMTVAALFENLLDSCGI